MRLLEVTGYTIEEMLAELDRRGFLKGLGGAAALAAVPSFAKAADSSKVKSAMDEILKLDPKILGYEIKGDTLVLKIDSKIEQGYQNFLKVKHKANRGNRPEPKDALEYYGFTDQNSQYISKKTGMKNVRYEIVDRETKKSEPSGNTEEFFKNHPLQNAPWTMYDQVKAALKAADNGNKNEACFYINSASFIAKKESPAMYDKLQGFKSQLGC